MLGTVPLPREREEKDIPEFVPEINHSLKGVFDDVQQKLKDAQRKHKERHDKKNVGRGLAVGDRIWLYVPAVKQGRTRKLSSLWRGPYTVIDRVSAVTYRIQLNWFSRVDQVPKEHLIMTTCNNPTKKNGITPEFTPATPKKKYHSNQNTLPVPPTPKSTYKGGEQVAKVGMLPQKILEISTL